MQIKFCVWKIYQPTTKPQLAYEIGFSARLSQAGEGIPCRPRPYNLCDKQEVFLCVESLCRIITKIILQIQLQFRRSVRRSVCDSETALVFRVLLSFSQLISQRLSSHTTAILVFCLSFHSISIPFYLQLLASLWHSHYLVLNHVASLIFSFLFFLLSRSTGRYNNNLCTCLD